MADDSAPPEDNDSTRIISSGNTATPRPIPSGFTGQEAAPHADPYEPEEKTAPGLGTASVRAGMPVQPVAAPTAPMPASAAAFPPTGLTGLGAGREVSISPVTPTVIAAAAAVGPGAILGNTYEIVALLARGGMGEVYRAKHIELGTEHAIKVMIPSLASDPKIVELFREEARKLGRIRVDAIVNYEGFFRDEHGLRYLVMEFVEGDSLDKILRGRAMSPDEVLHLRDRMAFGLAAAHDKGIIHRDISPENIILPGGSVDNAKLIDFGIAKSTNAGDRTVIGSDFAGKFSYVSPEQAGLYGGEVDHRSDIYSLGLVLAAAAIGFGKKLDMGNSLPTMLKSRERVPDLSAVPAALRPVIAPMLEPDPARRPPTMRALSGTTPGGAAAPRSSVSSGASTQGKKSMLPLIGGGVVLALAAAGGVAFWTGFAAAPSAEEIRSKVATIVAGPQCAALDYDVAPDRAVRVSGYAASGKEIEELRRAVTEIPGVGAVNVNVALRIRPHCEVARILTPVVNTTPTGGSLALASGLTSATNGDRLSVDIHAPAFDGFVYVDYYDSSGQVRHLLPNDRDMLNFRPARNHLVLGRPPAGRCWLLDGSPGEQLVTMIASRRPLFSDKRAEQESAQDYLTALSAALGKASSADTAASTLFFDLRDRGSTSSRDAACQTG